MGTSLLILACLSLYCAEAFQFYQEVIPNGDLVPHPCKPNYLWKGVGHFNVLGGGGRNPFGEDFANNGKKWNRQLCEMDSDEDGRSNGEELGDPRCLWTPEGGAAETTASGHPGVCEPVDSELCKAKNAAAKEDWKFCEQGEFKCDAINEPGVKNFTIAIEAGTRVPAQDTTYMCQMMKIPDDQQYHIVATVPAIDNQIVAHHIIVYGCDETALRTLSHYLSPQICDAMAIREVCSHNIRGWTVGFDGFCDIPDVGTLFGKGVFNYAVIEVHWNNPKEEANYVDGSGLTVFYTPNLRKYDAGRLAVGQIGVAIPPNAETHYQTAVCSSDCTNTLKEPIKMYSVLLHMHYLGRAGGVEHWRNGRLYRVLANQTVYSYDSPLNIPIDPPAELRAGDEIKMFCKFKSKSRKEVTYFGDATSDEMCFAFLSYYPLSTFRTCSSFGPADFCFSSAGNAGIAGRQSQDFLKKVGCDVQNGEDMIKTFVLQAAGDCGGLGNPVCTAECKEFFRKAYTEQKCLKDGLRFAVERMLIQSNKPMAKTLIEFLHVCDKEILPVNSKVEHYNKRDYLVEKDVLENDEEAAGAAGQLTHRISLMFMTTAMALKLVS